MDTTVDQTERAYRAALYEVDGIGPRRMRVLLDAFGSAKRVWEEKDATLREIGLSEKVVAELQRRRRNVEPAEHLRALAKLGIRVVLIEDEEYPELLKQIEYPPPVLFARGHFEIADRRAEILSIRRR